ncbi:MAG: hypothetical protein LBR29_10915, partial [Methylobacteriaceae bacterium]|nr:hypothetical protein [Methylobacteriaceae bacterium]
MGNGEFLVDLVDRVDWVDRVDLVDTVDEFAAPPVDMTHRRLGRHPRETKQSRLSSSYKHW